MVRSSDSAESQSRRGGSRASPGARGNRKVQGWDEQTTANFMRPHKATEAQTLLIMQTQDSDRKNAQGDWQKANKL